MSYVKTGDILLIDVRTPQELLENGSIPGSTNIPVTGTIFDLKSFRRIPIIHTAYVGLLVLILSLL